MPNEHEFKVEYEGELVDGAGVPVPAGGLMRGKMTGELQDHELIGHLRRVLNMLPVEALPTAQADLSEIERRLARARLRP